MCDGDGGCHWGLGFGVDGRRKEKGFPMARVGMEQDWIFILGVDEAEL